MAMQWPKSITCVTMGQHLNGQNLYIQNFNRIKVQGDRINGIVFQHTIELFCVLLFKNKIGKMSPNFFGNISTL